MQIGGILDLAQTLSHLRLPREVQATHLIQYCCNQFNLLETAPWTDFDGKVAG